MIDVVINIINMFNMLFSRYNSLGGIYYCHFIEKETDLGEILGPHSLQASEPGDLNTCSSFSLLLLSPLQPKMDLESRYNPSFLLNNCQIISPCGDLAVF